MPADERPFGESWRGSVLTSRRGALNTAMFAALLAMAAANAGCQRSLAGAHCGCVPGWVCCESTQLCVPEGQASLCPDQGPSDAHAESLRADGGTDDTQLDRPDFRPDLAESPDAIAPDATAADASAPDQRPVGDATPDVSSSDTSSVDSALGDAPGRDAPPADEGPPPNTPQACTSEGWCWTHPLPTSDTFSQIFAVAPDDVWIVGASGTVLRFAGGAWSAMPSPAAGLSAVWGNGSDDVWAGGPSGLFHWNGKAWALVPPIGLSPNVRGVNAIWGCAANDVWAVGTSTRHWDGTTWTPVTVPDDGQGLRAVWGAGCNDVWAGSIVPSNGSGRTIHWNGATWAVTAQLPLERIAGTANGDVWSLAQGQLFHWAKSGVPAPFASHVLDLFPIGGAGVGLMNDARLISAVGPGGPLSLSTTAPEGIRTLWGRSLTDIWGIGALGVASHWDGASWTSHLPAWSLGNDRATKITGSGPADLWAVVGASLLHGAGTGWRTALAPSQIGGRIWDVWARTPDDVWVLGGDALIHRWNGSGWRTEDPVPRGTTTPEMRVISASGPADVWIVRGTSSILHWDGTTWVSREPGVGRISDVWSNGPNDTWVAGDRLAHWTGTGWLTPRISMGAGSVPFTAVAGSGATDVWAVAGGDLYAVTELDATVVLSTGLEATALFVAGPRKVWVLIKEAGVTSRIFPVTGTAPSDLGTALVAPAELNDLWVAADGTLWAAGQGGALLRRAPTP